MAGGSRLVCRSRFIERLTGLSPEYRSKNMVPEDSRGRRESAFPLWLLICVLLAIIWSWVGAFDRGTWWLESFPALIAIAILAATYRKFRFTNLAYLLIAVHACILLVGGHYTYAKVPLFDWVRDHFRLERNDYDKLGHFAQGFVPAIVAREILIRRRVISGPWWRVFVVMCICVAISASYELLEWGVALLEGSGADAFLGTQGDPWDTQSDMLCALIGAAAAQISLARVHDRQLEGRPRTSPVVEVA
jgi:putative membrane protein